MNKFFNIIITISLVSVLVWASGVAYVVDETHQVVVTQFGEPIGDSIDMAGLYFKLPVPIQKANYFDKRVLEWDGDPNQIPTRDKRYIWVDTTARWRIVDALKFMKSVGSESAAQSRLDDLIDGATRDTISNLKLIETVRSSNRIIDYPSEDTALEGLSQVETLERIKVGRNQLTRTILEEASKSGSQFGIEFVDVRIKRISYVKDVRLKVYDRMISERKRAAEQFRAEGRGKTAEIQGQVIKELEEIQSVAFRKAQEIKGQADAEAIKIYADAYNNDPEFYSFLKTLEIYPESITKDTTMILTTDSDFYKYLKGIDHSN